MSLGQLLLRREGVELDLADATAENPDGQFADSEGPGNASSLAFGISFFPSWGFIRDLIYKYLLRNAML